MTGRPIRKVLVANRGEIALRIMRTCRRMGLATVAVYSEADAALPFVAFADEAVELGPAAPAESYLSIDRLLAAAQRTQADAIHPGYGFLSENAAFAQRVLEAGLTFIGPSPQVIAAMGSKTGARAIMQHAGVPVVPGAELAGLSEQEVIERARQVGYPVLVKAAFGGGGRGMRVVAQESGLLPAIASARREALGAFGDETVFLERYVESPRHVELQIFGDAHGHAIHLFERECSIQRRHQKVIEESPSPGLDEALRRKMGAAAVTAARAIGYVGAGTVEFIVAPSGEFFFLEVNTRLQVEHPVTELITGLDLVRLQVLVAQGLPLPAEALAATRQGHAVEARLCAEEPLAEYLPAAGHLHTFELSSEVRVDSGFETGSEVSIHYDSMLAKVIAHAPTRAEAIGALAASLDRARLHGVSTNRDLLVAILRHPEFQAGQTDTHFLQRHPPSKLLAATQTEGVVRLHAAAAVLAAQARRRAEAGVARFAPSAFRNNRSQLQRHQLEHRGRLIAVGYTLDRQPRVEVDGVALDGLVLHRCTDTLVDLTFEGVRRRCQVMRAAGVAWVDSALGHSTFTEVERFPEAKGEVATGSLMAPMPGTVVRVNVALGQLVEAGAVLVVLEAMKMEHAIVAPAAGTVSELTVKVKDTVAAGDVLVVIDGAGGTR